MAKKAIDKEYLARQFQNFWDKTKSIGNSRLVNNSISYSKVNSSFASNLSSDLGLKTVATSGSYNDLSNRPTIPTVDSSLSTSSTNPVRNSAVTSALNGKLSSSALTRSTYSPVSGVLLEKSGNVVCAQLYGVDSVTLSNLVIASGWRPINIVHFAGLLLSGNNLFDCYIYVYTSGAMGGEHYNVGNSARINFSQGGGTWAIYGNATWII